MKILSIDTSSDICGVSILENNNLIYNFDISTGRTHSENLMPMIVKGFENLNISLNDINLLVCDIGPGSFTGIRIGVATVKAFSDSLDIPCIGISSLESLAYNVSNSKIVFSILDCKNDNCYFALYENNNGYYENLIEPQAETIESAITILKDYAKDNFENEEITFVGDGVEVFEKQIKENFENIKISTSNKLNSFNLGICGYKKYQNGYDLNTEILPLYLKKPQAQRQLEQKLKGAKNG